MKEPQYDALLLYGSSEQDANLFYATKMFVPDPFFFFQKKGKKFAVMSDLELDRAKAQADVDRVISGSKIQRQVAKKLKRPARDLDVLEFIFRRQKIKTVAVPTYFPISVVENLRKRGLKVVVKPDPVFPERRRKTAAEVRAITQTSRCVEAAIAKAIAFLRHTKIKGPYLWHRGRKVTPADVKRVINVSLMENNCVAQHTIVAGGDEACDPHNTGFKPLQAHKAIVMDIFPRSVETGYYADITRTVVRGKPSAELKELYRAVLEAQKIGLREVRPGVRGRDIHQAIVDYFKRRGYKTGMKDGFIQGFIHGTGHGLGLEVHEPPRLSRSDDILQPGDVVTVEPGLYYRGLGGVRLEDDVLVTRTGHRILTQFPKQFIVH